MKKTKILSLLLAVAMFCALFTGCFGSKTVMKVGGNAISKDIYEPAVAYADVFFQQNYGFSMAEMLGQELADGKTGADMLKENADGLIKEFESVALFAKEKGIELSAEDKKEAEENKAAQIESAGGRKAFLDELKESGINEAFFDYMVERQQIYNKLYTELFEGEGEFAPSEEEIIKSLEGYARVKHILIQAQEGAEDYAAKKAEAEKYAARAKAGEDFDALIKEVADAGDGDPGMQSSPNGYVIDANGYTTDGVSQMIPEFTSSSHALAVGGISDIVPTSYGFHIIKRYPFDAAYIKENIVEYSYAAGSTAFAAKLTEYMENVEIEKTAAYDDIDVYKILGVEKTNGEAAGTAEHSEDDGHDHESDSEGGIEVGEAVPAEDAGEAKAAE